MKTFPTLVGAGLGAMLAGCAPPLPAGGRTGPVPSTPPPTLSVAIGTVDAGSGHPFRVVVPVTDAQRELLRTGTLNVQSDVVTLAYAGTVPNAAPGAVVLTGTTRHVANCEMFSTGVAVEVGGREMLRLDLKARVRRAFTVRPIVGGRRYALALAPGVRPPEVAARPTGYETAVVAAGRDRAELVVTRTGTPRLPGGTIRLVDRASGDARTVALPLPFIPSRGGRYGEFVDSRGELRITARDRRIADRPDVTMVLDPPGAYAVRWRGTQDGALALVLRSLTPKPVDLRVGLRRGGAGLSFRSSGPPRPERG